MLPTPDEPREKGPRVVDPAGTYPGLQIGDAAPALELATIDRGAVPLRSLYEQSPLIVIFYDGGWRDESLDHLRAWAEWAERPDDLAENSVTLLAISPESPERMRQTIETTDAPFTFATDPAGAAMKAFHVAFEVDDATRDRFDIGEIDLESWNGSGNGLLPAPSTFVIDQRGVVRWAYSGWRPADRARPTDAVNAARIHR